MAEALSPREIAIGVWLLAGLALALSVRRIRKSFLGLLRAFFADKILVFVGAMLLYTSVVIAVLLVLGFWETALLKDTVFWFVFSGLALGFRVAMSHESDLLLRKTLWDTLRVLEGQVLQVSTRI